MKLRSFLIGFFVGALLLAFGGSVFATIKYSNSFNDVGTGDWFHPYVMELSEKNYVKGYADGNFGVNNFITRAEAAKLIRLLDERIEFLESALEIEHEYSDGGFIVEKIESRPEHADEEPEDSEGDQIVLNVSVDLESEKTLAPGYALFEESINQNFSVQYPANLFWNNTYGASDGEDSYIWKTSFGENDFEGLEDHEIGENERIVVYLVSPDEAECEREVLIFVERDEETSFLIAGDLADLAQLQNMAVSLTNL